MQNVTLTRYLVQEKREGRIDADVVGVMEGVVSACKSISNAINHGSLYGYLGSAEVENVQGETQKKLDIMSNDMFLECNQWGGYLAGMGSEEMEDPYQIPGKYPKGKYLLLFDPLDGSSNIDVNLTVGSIFSILKAPGSVAGEVKEEAFLQPGTAQIGAGFCLYGPATMMVLTFGNGVKCFTLNNDNGEFVLTNDNVTIPEDTKEFAINMSNQRFWEEPMQRYIDECLQGKEGARGKDFNMRWVASMVAEVYRILVRGGIFMYPMDKRDPSKPGKLRLMYEANPMSFIIEQAGGASSTGRQRIMELTPQGLHQRCPVVLGSKNEVDRVVSYHKE